MFNTFIMGFQSLFQVPNWINESLNGPSGFVANPIVFQQGQLLKNQSFDQQHKFEGMRKVLNQQKL